MQARRWKLPGVQDLTKDQESALEENDYGQCLIIGGPGTGKTVVMVMRAIKLYNHMLHGASKQMDHQPFKSDTYHSWFWHLYRNMTGNNPPLLRDDRSNFKPYDWKACLEEVSAIPIDSLPKQEDYIVLVDEGQDMPPEFYEILIKIGYENLFIAADQNQQIHTNSNSSRKDLENSLAISNSDVIELRQNFRNNHEIARLARHFYTGDPASPPPEIPEPRGRLHVPILYTFKDHSMAYDNFSKKLQDY